MLNLPQQLAQLSEPITVGVVGVGQMGAGVVTVMSRMKGMEVAAIADIDQERALTIFQEIGVDAKNVTVSDDPAVCERALEQGKRVVSPRADTIPAISSLEVVVESTGAPRVGADVAFAAIQNQKHVVMMNVETDITVGSILADLAQNAGVVYTVGAGDEPGAVKELYDFAVSLGFKVVAAGKGKNNPLDRTATPESLKREAAAQGVNPKMLCEFVDGSKTMIEMCAVANATGLIPDVRGMHGPKCDVEQLASVFALKEQGGVLHQEGVVDFGIGRIAPGVFVVITTENPRLITDLAYFSMGRGPNYLLYRPYHLCSIEVPISAARAVLYEEPTLVARGVPVAEVITVAKRDLEAGHRLDGIGRFDMYGSIEQAGTARDERLLPLGLAEGAVLTESVPQGDYITLDQVEFPEQLTLLDLRRLQDRFYAPADSG